MVVYLKLSQYLKEWYIHEQGGHEPVKPERSSVESAMLRAFLRKLPEGAQPQTGEPEMLAMTIPSFPEKDPRTYCYLPPKAHDALVACIRTRFDMEMWKELHRFVNISRRQDELIYAFMEKHGIEETEQNFNAIAKRYQRKREAYKRREGKNKKNRTEFNPAKADDYCMSMSERFAESAYNKEITE